MSNFMVKALNIITRCTKTSSSFAPSQSKRILNAIRILTRALPFLFEINSKSSSSLIEETIFWTIRPKSSADSSNGSNDNVFADNDHVSTAKISSHTEANINGFAGTKSSSSTSNVAFVTKTQQANSSNNSISSLHSPTAANMYDDSRRGSTLSSLTSPILAPSKSIAGSRNGSEDSKILPKSNFTASAQVTCIGENLLFSLMCLLFWPGFCLPMQKSGNMNQKGPVYAVW